MWNPADLRILKDDIAVLILTKSVQFSDYIKPVCLSTTLSNLNSGMVAGWFWKDYYNYYDKPRSNTKRHVIEIPWVNKRDCHTDHVEGKWDKTFCAGSRNVSVCVEDSGSGLFVMLNDKFYLRGIISTSTSSQRVNKGCYGFYFVLFTDATKYINFLKISNKI